MVRDIVVSFRFGGAGVADFNAKCSPTKIRLSSIGLINVEYDLSIEGLSLFGSFIDDSGFL